MLTERSFYSSVVRFIVPPFTEQRQQLGRAAALLFLAEQSEQNQSPSGMDCVSGLL
jgi:hypothetical protein